MMRSEAERQRQRVYYEANRERILAKYSNNRDKFLQQRRDNHKQRLYGLSRADYGTLVDRAAGRCECCHEVFSKRPNVEHDHGTGLVRGLVCASCNRAISVVDDYSGRFAAAIEWVANGGPE